MQLRKLRPFHTIDEAGLTASSRNSTIESATSNLALFAALGGFWKIIQEKVARPMRLVRLDFHPEWPRESKENSGEYLELSGGSAKLP